MRLHCLNCGRGRRAQRRHLFRSTSKRGGPPSVSALSCSRRCTEDLNEAMDAEGFAWMEFRREPNPRKKEVRRRLDPGLRPMSFGAGSTERKARREVAKGGRGGL